MSNQDVERALRDLCKVAAIAVANAQREGLATPISELVNVHRVTDFDPDHPTSPIQGATETVEPRAAFGLPVARILLACEESDAWKAAEQAVEASDPLAKSRDAVLAFLRAVVTAALEHNAILAEVAESEIPRFVADLMDPARSHRYVAHLRPVRRQGEPLDFAIGIWRCELRSVVRADVEWEYPVAFGRTALPPQHNVPTAVLTVSIPARELHDPFDSAGHVVTAMRLFDVSDVSMVRFEIIPDYPRGIRPMTWHPFISPPQIGYVVDRENADSFQSFLQHVVPHAVYPSS
jgi:hypothetical protein